MGTTTVSSRVLWPFVAALQRSDYDVRADLESVQLKEGQLRDPEVRVPYATAHRLIGTLVEHSERGDLGLLAAREVERGYFDLLELVVRSAPNLGEAIEYLLRFFWLIDDGADLTLTRGPVESRMGLVVTCGQPVHPAYLEFLPAMLLLGARRETGLETMGAERVFFRHPAPAPVELYEEFFLAPVSFDAAETVATFRSDLLEIPFRRANAPLRDEAVALISDRDYVSKDEPPPAAAVTARAADGTVWRGNPTHS